MSEVEVGIEETPGFARPVSKKSLPATARTFVGDGSGVLPVPGLSSVSFVSVSGVELPETLLIRMPNPRRLEEYIDVPQPMYRIENPGTPEAVLLRCLSSNFGIWQVGAEIVIDGIWAAEKGSAKTEKVSA